MNLQTITKDYNFEAAHILQLPYMSQCKNLHGHSYKVTIGLVHELDSVGMVYDYVLLNQLIKPLIDSLDHKLMLPKKFAEVEGSSVHFTMNGFPRVVHTEEVILLDIPNTTAEHLAGYIAKYLLDRHPIFHSLLCSVTVKETEKTAATIQVKE